LWTQAAGGDAAKAMADWKAQTSAAGTPAIVPSGGAVNPARFARFATLAQAFSKPLSGCMGMADDYNFKDVGQACDALGLQPAWYADGAFVLKIDSAALEGTVAEAAKAGGGIGKATVFTSLMFSEFNYNVEDRAYNETESGDVAKNPNAKQNTGKKSAGGKVEVVVQKFAAADIFAQSPTFLR
jgi:hypothetical protein